MKLNGILFLCLAANLLNAQVLSPNTNLTAREEQNQDLACCEVLNSTTKTQRRED
ncbi:MAG: hypothetical protein ABSH11_11240 [Verrucomicrobiota bacterium]|jgi:hypothetical protein